MITQLESISNIPAEDPSSYEDLSEEESEPEAPKAIIVFENPYEDQMEEKRKFLLEYYLVIRNCVTRNLSLHPRMDPADAMIECTGPQFRIMVHEYNQTMIRVADLYQEMLRGKFKLLGEGYEPEIEEFIANMKDFIVRDFDVKETLAVSIRGAKVVVNEKLYQDLINASKDELGQLEDYRKELTKGRDNIIMGIRDLFDNREKQLKELMEEEKRLAQQALEDEKKRISDEEEAAKKEEYFNSEESEESDHRKADFDEDESQSEDEDDDSESEEHGGSSHASESEEEDPRIRQNFVDAENNSMEMETESMDYDNISSSHKIFDEFQDIDDDKETLEEHKDSLIDDEWERLKQEGEIDPQYDYVDDLKKKK